MTSTTTSYMSVPSIDQLVNLLAKGTSIRPAPHPGSRTDNSEFCLIGLEVKRLTTFSSGKGLPKS